MADGCSTLKSMGITAIRGHAMPVFAALAIAASAISASAAHAGPPTFPAPSPPVAVNSYATIDSSSETGPAISTNGDGVWIAVWSSPRRLDGNGNADTDIHFARSVDGGLTWSEAASIDANALNDGTASDRLPAIATDGEGVWMVAWSTDTAPGKPGPLLDQDIIFARSTDDGLSWSTPAVLNGNAFVDDRADEYVQLSARHGGGGGFIAVWRTTDDLLGTIGNDGDVLCAFTADGVTWTPPAIVNSTAASDPGVGDQFPMIAGDASGNWVCAWQSTNTLGGTIGTDTDILYARSIDDGATWTAAAALNSHAGSDGTATDERPTITQQGGIWLCAWQSTYNAGGLIGAEGDILWSRSVNAGASWTPAAVLNSTAESDGTDVDSRPMVVGNDSGSWLAAWMSDGSIGTDIDVLFATSEDYAVTWTPAQPLNTNAASDSGNDEFPAVAHDGASRWVGAWESRGTLGRDRDLLSAALTFPSCETEGTPPRTDCNENGIEDFCDLLNGTSTDADGNTIPDECDPPPPPRCPADITGDRAVGIADLLAVIGAWGQTGGPAADVSGDGVVGIADLLAVIGAWGPC